MFSFVKRSVAEYCEQDVASASGEGYEGLVVAFALGDLAVVVGAGDRVAESRESGKEQRSFEDFVASFGGVLAANG